MKRLLILLIILLINSCITSRVLAEEIDVSAAKLEITALYNANSLKEAYSLISSIPEDKRDADIWLLAANITQDYGKEKDAIFLLQKAIKVNPSCYKAYYNLGNIYFNLKQYNVAAGYYKNALKHNKDFAYASYNLGCAYYALDNFRAAKRAFQHAIVLDSTVPEFYFNLGLTYKRLGNEKQSKKMFDNYHGFNKQS